MASKKTFYVVSDIIQTKSKDKARIRAVVEAFKSLGHNAVEGDVDPNEHTRCTKYKKSMGKNDVWVTIFGGVCGGTIADMTGYSASGVNFGTWFKNDQLKKGSLFVIWVSSPEGSSINVKNAKKLPKAHDDNFSPKGFNGIPNPVSYLKKKGVTWIEAGTTSAIVNLIKAQNWEGSGFDIDGDTSTREIKNEKTITHGYDKQTPFEAYIKVEYSVNDPKGTKYPIYIDWQTKAPSNDKKFTNNYAIQWINRQKFVHQINLLEKVRVAHQRDYGGTETDKYYLRTVTFMRDFKDQHDDKSTEEDESKLYKKDEDKSSYKMLLYDLGVFRGEIAYLESLGVGGKTILDAMKNVMEKAKYNFSIQYGLTREKDVLNFAQITDNNQDIVHTFNEGFDGDVIGISNIKYSPTAQLMNSSIYLYKKKKYENKDTMIYSYARKCKLKEIMRYGEQQKVESTSEDRGHIEALQTAYNNLMEYFRPYTTFTVKSVGLPPIEIGNWVATEMINPLLSNEYQVASRKINIDVTDRPMIQTEYGLGDIDANIKVKKNLAEQRKKLVRKPLDIDEPVYFDTRLNENNLWVD